MSQAVRADRDPISHESIYVAGSESPDAAIAIAGSLRALLRTRCHPIRAHRFTLLDTFDSRVTRKGARLTRSTVKGTATLALAPGNGQETVRQTVAQSPAFAWELPEGPLQEALAPIIGVRRLLPQAETAAEGSLLDVLDERRKTVARLRIESGQARLPVTRSTWHPLPTIVTLTGLRGYEDVYAQLVEVIKSRPGLSACPDGLSAVILRQAGAAVGNLPHLRVDLSPDIPAEIGARRIHQLIASILVANESGLRENLDTEFLHDFRVALRRARSLLRQLKHVFPSAVVDHFSTEFSWLGQLTSTPRDLDVLVLMLRSQQDVLADGDLEALITFFSRAVTQARRPLVEALDGPRYRALLAEWRTFLTSPVLLNPTAPDASLPLAHVVSRRAWKLSRRIIKSAKTIDNQTDATKLHEVRIDAKKLRYLIDVTPAFYDADDLGCILDALKQLQRVLGDSNDAQVQETRLLDYGRALGEAGGRPSALLALGRLAERSRQRRRHLNSQVAESLGRFRSRTVRSACRRAFKRDWPQESAT